MACKRPCNSVTENKAILGNRLPAWVHWSGSVEFLDSQLYLCELGRHTGPHPQSDLHKVLSLLRLSSDGFCIRFTIEYSSETIVSNDKLIRPHLGLSPSRCSHDLKRNRVLNEESKLCGLNIIACSSLDRNVKLVTSTKWSRRQVHEKVVGIKCRFTCHSIDNAKHCLSLQ